MEAIIAQAHKELTERLGSLCLARLHEKNSSQNGKGYDQMIERLDDEWPESIFHHVGSQSASYLLSVL